MKFLNKCNILIIQIVYGFHRFDTFIRVSHHNQGNIMYKKRMIFNKIIFKFQLINLNTFNSIANDLAVDMKSQKQQSTDELGRVNHAAGNMNLPGLDEVEPDTGDHLGSAMAGGLNSRRKAQDRRTAHQSNNPSFANNVDAMKATGHALLAEQMLLHPRDASNSALAKQKSDPLRKQQTYMSKHSDGVADRYDQPQEEAHQQMEENVCDDESLVVDPMGHAQARYHQIQSAMGDDSMEGTIYSNAALGPMMQTPSTGAGSQQTSTAVSTASFISPNIAKFKQNLLKTLQKFAKVHTQKKAAEELKQLMTTDITDNERMNMFLNQLAEINDHMNLGQMKEQFKQFGVAAEIFEDALVPFIPKILNNFQKKIRDEATVKLHPVISEALGQLEWHVLGRVEDSEEQLQLFERHFQKLAFGMIEKTKSKNVQCGAIACLTKIIVNCPDDILFEKFEEITDKMCDIVKTKQFLAHQQFLESLISLIFHIQIDFKYYYEKFLPYLIEQIQKSKDAQTKRVAIDALYSIGAHLKDEITGHIDDLLPILNVCRVDKNQPVRAAAQETIKLFKELKEQKLNQSFDDQISNEYFQQDLIQDSDVLDNLNDSTYIDKNLARTDTRKKRKMPPGSSNMAALVRDESSKNNNNLYPSFADMQSSHEQHINSGEGQFSQQYIEQIPEKPKNNRRSERSLSQSKNNDMDDRQASKQRIRPYKRPGRCKSPSLNQNLGEIDEPEDHMTSVRSQKAAVQSKSRAQAESRRRQDSLKHGKNNQMKSQTNMGDSISPHRLGSPGQQPQDGKSQRSNIKGTTQPVLDASLDMLHSQQEMLLNPAYLKDKSIKKVSIATLKRRMNQQKNSASPEKGPNSASAQEKQASNNRRQRKGNLRLGAKSKQDQSEYDEVPLSQKGATTPNQRRGNFLEKLNPSFMNKFNDAQMSGQLRDKDTKKGTKFGGKVMAADSISGISEINCVENDVSITVVSGKPPDFEYLQEIQRMAELKYQEQQQEEEERYKGLTTLEKRKKIIEDTKLLMSQEGKSGDKKANKNAKSAKDKKEGRSKPPKSQRPKWQNIIDDDEDDKKTDNEGPRYPDDEQKRVSSTDKKHKNKHKLPNRKNMLDSDREQDDVNSQEDVQIIIKTDKHSQQRTIKKDIYESEYNESRGEALDPQQTSNANPAFHTVNQSRDSFKKDDHDRMRKQNQMYGQPEEQYENGAQRPKQQPSGIAWLSQQPKESKSQVHEDQQVETGSMSHHSMQRTVGGLKMGSMTQSTDLTTNQQNDGIFRANLAADGGLDPARSQFMLKNQMKTFDQNRNTLPQQSNFDSQLVSQTSILQQIQQQMMHFQLEQQKQMQNMEIFNSKFETVVGKLNAIQKNYEQLESQQKEMDIQLQKQARATDLLNDQYRSLLQHQTTGPAALAQSHRANANYNAGGTYSSGMQESASIGHLLQEATPTVHQADAANFEKTDQLQKQLLQEFYQKLERDRVLAGQQQKLEQMQREQQKEQQSRLDIQQLSNLINRLNSPAQAQHQMPELGGLVQQSQNAQQTQTEQMQQIKKLQESLDIVQAISSKTHTSDQLLNTLLLTQQIQQRQQQLGSDTQQQQPQQVQLQKQLASGGQGTPSAALQGTNPLLLSHLLSNMNNPTGKQSVLDPANLEALSALASNREMSGSNAGLISGGADNVGSAVHSVAFQGDAGSEHTPATNHKDSTHAKDY